jgi:hypothetical protein
MFTTMRISNITKIRVFINKLLNIIFAVKISVVKGGWTKGCCTVRNFMDYAVCLVLARQLRQARH